MTAITEQSWARDLLIRMHFPVTRNNMVSVLAWEYQEGGHFHNDARYNPLNTTRDHAKYGSINSVGVATYPDYRTGMDETVKTLRQDDYAAVRHDLAANAAPEKTTAAVSHSPWGTWAGGASTAAAVSRARSAVHAHPGWVRPAKGGDHKAHQGHHDKAHDKGHGKTRKGTKHPAGGSHKVVLDLAELSHLSRVYRDAGDQVVAHRRAVSDIADSIEAARQALPDPALATALKSMFTLVLEPNQGFDRDARQMDELSAYLDDVHRLAEQADANHDGKWSKKEALHYMESGKLDNHSPAGHAVLEALLLGTIVKSAKDLPHGGAHGARPKAGGKAGGKSGGKSTGQHPGGSSRQARIDKVLAVAKKQHFTEHNGDNRNPYGAWYGDNGQPWCAMYVSYVFAHSGNPLPAIDGAHGYLNVNDGIAYARAHHQLHSTPHVGDIFLYKDGEHTGIVTKVYGNGTFDTSEGNWSNQVAHVHRDAHDGKYWFWTAIH